MEKSLEKYLDYLRHEKNYSAHTILAYENDIRGFLGYLYELGIADLKIKYEQVRGWIVELSEEKLSNRSINRKISALRNFYCFLLRIGDVDENPLVLHKSLKIEKKLQLPFSVNEIKDVVDLIKKDEGFESMQALLIVEMLYSLGIRRSELCNIKLQDIDLGNKVVKIVGKGNKMRYIPLINSLIDLLQRYCVQRENSFDSPPDKEYLFLNKKGVKINEMFVYRLINSYFSEVTSKEKKSPHMLRHSFATHLLEGGADVNSIKELMGHESLSSTEIYAQVNLKELKRMYLESHPRVKTRK